MKQENSLALNIVITVLFAVININCYTTKTDKNTEIISAYLKNNFNLEIPIETHYYVIVPKNGCQGAIVKTLIQLDSNLKTSCPITVITSNKTIVSEYLHQKWEILTDISGDIDILNLPISNVSVIGTKNKRIVMIKSSSECNSDIVKQILALLKNC